jgi:hypothetical protein
MNLLSNVRRHLMRMLAAENGAPLVIVDLPGPHSGIHVMEALFETLGFQKLASDYLPGRSISLSRFGEEESVAWIHAQSPLPELVAAEFRLDALSREAAEIVLKHSLQANGSPVAEARDLAFAARRGDVAASRLLLDLYSSFLSRRDWAPPSVEDHRRVRHENELLAQVLAFGRLARPQEPTEILGSPTRSKRAG